MSTVSKSATARRPHLPAKNDSGVKHNPEPTTPRGKRRAAAKKNGTFVKPENKTMKRLSIRIKDYETMMKGLSGKVNPDAFTRPGSMKPVR